MIGITTPNDSRSQSKHFRVSRRRNRILFHQVLKVYYVKMVTFEVTERPLIQEIAYEAIDQATPEEIREEWRLQRIDLSVGSEFDPLKAKRAAAAIKRLLAKRGDQQAKVNSMVERRSPTNVSIVFKVEE